MHTAIVEQRGHGWVGSVEDVPGVVSRGRSRGEVIVNLESALGEALGTHGAGLGRVTRIVERMG